MRQNAEAALHTYLVNDILPPSLGYVLLNSQRNYVTDICSNLRSTQDFGSIL